MRRRARHNAGFSRSQARRSVSRLRRALQIRIDGNGARRANPGYGSRRMQPPPTTAKDSKRPLGKHGRPPPQRPQSTPWHVTIRIRVQSIFAAGRLEFRQRFRKFRPVLGNMGGEHSCVTHQDPGRHHCALLPQVLRDPPHGTVGHSQYRHTGARLGFTRHQIVFVNCRVDIDHAEGCHSFRNRRQHLVQCLERGGQIPLIGHVTPRRQDRHHIRGRVGPDRQQRGRRCQRGHHPSIRNETKFRAYAPKSGFPAPAILFPDRHGNLSGR